MYLAESGCGVGAVVSHLSRPNSTYTFINKVFQLKADCPLSSRSRVFPLHGEVQVNQFELELEHCIVMSSCGQEMARTGGGGGGEVDWEEGSGVESPSE